MFSSESSMQKAAQEWLAGELRDVSRLAWIQVVGTIC